MTEKLFYEDQYIKEFTANIVNIIEDNEKYLVELDKSAFFPGGGGQFCDTGVIDGIEVIDMLEKDKKIYHVMSQKPNKLQDVKCSINWNRRLDGMQQHLGQHLLSGCFFDLFNANTCGIHIGDEVSTVDIVGEIEEEKIREAEKMANRVIRENHKVTFLFTNRKQAKAMGLRRELATKDSEIRIVKIEDIDINACCGVHPSNTFELQLIKIKRWEKHKGNTRIEYLVGDRAVQDYLKRDAILDSICDELSTGSDDAVKSVENLKESINNLKNENNKIKVALSKYEIKDLINDGEKIGDVIVISKIYKGENVRYLNKLATKVTEKDNHVILLATYEEDKVNLIFAASKNMDKINISNVLKDAIVLIDGKGGGSKILAQGGGKNISNLDNAMEYAKRKVKEGI